MKLGTLYYELFVIREWFICTVLYNTHIKAVNKLYLKHCFQPIEVKCILLKLASKSCKLQKAGFVIT